MNTQMNGLGDTCPRPDASGAEYRKWWWRGYYYQNYMIEHPQQTAEPDPRSEKALPPSRAVTP